MNWNGILIFSNLIFLTWKKIQWHWIFQKTSIDQQEDCHYSNFSFPLLICSGLLEYSVPLDFFSSLKFQFWKNQNSISVLTWVLVYINWGNQGPIFKGKSMLSVHKEFCNFGMSLSIHLSLFFQFSILISRKLSTILTKYETLTKNGTKFWYHFENLKWKFKYLSFEISQ